MGQVFVSHSAEDAEDVRLLIEQLKRWVDGSHFFVSSQVERGLTTGKVWVNELLIQLRSSQLFIAIVTPSWQASRWCFAEFTHALRDNKIVVPVLLKPCEIRPELSIFQFRDLTHDTPERYHAELDRLIDDLRKLVMDPGSFPLPADGQVFCGLGALTEEHAGVLFGRARETSQAIQEVRGLLGRGGLLLLVGPSGSGKSSLLRAGIIPRLRKLSRDCVVVGAVHAARNPFDQLARALARTADPDDEPAQRVAHAEFGPALNERADDPAQAGEWVRQRLRDLQPFDGQPRTTVLAVDQFEELLLPGPRPVGAPAFLQMLADLADGADAAPGDRVVVVATLRSDSLEAQQTHPALRHVNTEHLHVGLLPHDVLHEVVDGPAQRAGLSFETGLVDELVRDTQTGRSLPLLALTLQRMSDRAVLARGDRVFRWSDYRHLGGIPGTIKEMIEDDLLADGLGSAVSPDVLRQTFLALVDVVEDGRPVRRVASRDEFSDEQHGVLQRFVDHRLLVADEAHLQVAHEQLFEVWPRYRGWIANAKDATRAIRRAEAAARDWAAEGRPARLTWSDEQVVDVLRAYQTGISHERSRLLREFLGPLSAAEMLQTVADPDTGHLDRLRIGDRLALLGTPRPGVGVGPDGLPDLMWCDVPPGAVTLREGAEVHDDAVERSRQAGFLAPGRPAERGLTEAERVQVIEPGLQMTRYPITWSQYMCFVRDGFSDDRWWDPSWPRGEPPQEPRPAMAHHPTTGLSWYAAIAFGRWLSHELGYHVRIPTEWQWIQAATGGAPETFVYPWGDEWDPRAANTWEAGLRGTTAVGMYPWSRSPCGIDDMAGNAWEWCLNTVSSPLAADADPGEEPWRGGRHQSAPFASILHPGETVDEPWRVVKGGSWVVQGARDCCTEYPGVLAPPASYVQCIRLVRSFRS